jgi:phosphatidylglycerol lysyltransferase
VTSIHCPSGTIGQSPEDRHRTKRLLLDHGWNTTCFQILNPGIDRWFSKNREAVIGYVTQHGVRVVAGAPVCGLPDLEEVIREFESEAELGHEAVCYFGAEARMREFTGPRREYTMVALGAQPFWTAESFIDAFSDNASLRAQLNRARNKGIEVNEWSQDRAGKDPDLRRCLDDWIQTRGLPPLHFLVEPETLSALDGRRIFVAERKGRAIGFTVLSPVPQRNGYLTEQFVRGHEAPNGTVELGLFSAISLAKEEGSTYITMGIVPLSQHGQPATESNPNWLRILMRWVRAHGRRFYNFDGLDSFKSKFQPDGWEPIYAISKEPQFSFRTLYAIAAAFGNCSPGLMVLKGLKKAVRQEFKWIGERIKNERL